MNTQIITYIIGGLMVAVMALPLITKQYFASKAKGRMLVRTVQANGEEKTDLVKLEGSTTELNKKKRAYIPKMKIVNSETNQLVGNIATTYYPEGLPRLFQVKIQTMTAPEGNPMGINFYSEEKMLMTAQQVGTVHGEAYSKAVMATSSDAADAIKEIKGLNKGINKTVVYLMLGIIIIGVLGSVYLTFTNGEAISNIGNAWGW